MNFTGTNNKIIQDNDLMDNFILLLVVLKVIFFFKLETFIMIGIIIFIFIYIIYRNIKLVIQNKLQKMNLLLYLILLLTYYYILST